MSCIYEHVCKVNENPAMILQDIKETKRYRRTDGHTDGQRENSIPPTNKVCGGYNKGADQMGQLRELVCAIIVRKPPKTSKKGCKDQESIHQCTYGNLCIKCASRVSSAVEYLVFYLNSQIISIFAHA